VAAFCWPALEWPGIKTETSAQRWRKFSTFYAAAVPRISFSWRYTLSTPSVKGVGKVSRSVAAVATFWLRPLTVDGGGVPSLNSGVGKVDCYDLLFLERGLVVV
jgi:hypothetical protein